MARICVTDTESDKAYDITVDGNQDDTFDLKTVTAMLRTFADHIDFKLGNPKVAA